MKGVIKDTALLHADSYHPLRWKGVMLVLLDHSMLAPLALTSVAHDSPFPSNSYSRCPLILGVHGRGVEGEEREAKRCIRGTTAVCIVCSTFFDVPGGSRVSHYAVPVLTNCCVVF